MSLQHLGKSSTLDSIEIMMTVICRLPIDLQRSWVEHSVEIEHKTSDRARFIHLSEFLTAKSKIANSIFGRELYVPSNKALKNEIYLAVTANS